MGGFILDMTGIAIVVWFLMLGLTRSLLSTRSCMKHDGAWSDCHGEFRQWRPLTRVNMSVTQLMEHSGNGAVKIQTKNTHQLYQYILYTWLVIVEGKIEIKREMSARSLGFMLFSSESNLTRISEMEK